METKTKVFFFLVLSLFSLSLFSTTPAIAFAPHSFSQKAGNAFIWEIKQLKDVGEFIWENPQLGDRFKLVITAATSTPIGPYLVDTLLGKFYNNSAANRTWTLSTGETLIGLYHSSLGWETNPDLTLIAPHNATAVEDYFKKLDEDERSSTWTPGPNGYDGIGTVWDYDVTVLNSTKREYQYNRQGVAQIMKIYNATGTSWDQVLLAELIEVEGEGVPGFLVTSAIFTLGLCVALYALRLKRLPNQRI
jgi:hypothetical protein